MRQRLSDTAESYEIKVGNRCVGTSHPVFLIAEAGTAHMGSLDRGMELIDAAAENGADCVKFQWVIADEIVHPMAGSIRLPGGSIPIWERFRELERPPEFYHRLREHTERRGMTFLCSPFGVESARGLVTMGIDAVKIASPELNHFPLLDAVKELTLILSTGVSRLEDIERCMEHLRSGSSGTHEGQTAPGAKAMLLHCITAYPAPEEEYNLRVLPLLSHLFSVPAGVSDHSLDPLLVPLLSVSQGAVAVEKHLTLSRGNAGLDDPIALTPDGFGSMARHIRDFENESPESIIGYCSDRFSPERVEAVLGTGTKRLAPSEAAYYHTSNRSIVALRNLSPGDVLSPETMGLLRCEQNRIPGIAPHFWDTLCGASLRKFVKAGDGIDWGALLLKSGFTRQSETPR